jgi:hypothetical protein
VSFVGQPPGNGHQKITYILGHMKMSPDGSKIIMSDGDRGAELFRLIGKTGQVTDPISLPTPNAPANPTPYPVMYGMSFLPIVRYCIFSAKALVQKFIAYINMM